MLNKRNTFIETLPAILKRQRNDKTLGQHNSK